MEYAREYIDIGAERELDIPLGLKLLVDFPLGMISNIEFGDEAAEVDDL